MSVSRPFSLSPAPAYSTLTLSYSHDNRICHCQINRPLTLNSLNLSLLKDFYSFFDSLSSRSCPVHVVILSGAGRAFCSGADLSVSPNDRRELRKEWIDDQGGLGYYEQSSYTSLVQCIHHASQVFICVAHGHAAGGGMGILMASDMKIITKECKITPAFVHLGLSGGEFGSSYFLPKLLGPSITNEMLLSGRAITGKRAYELGMVNETYDTVEECLVGAMKMAEDVISYSILGVKMTKSLLRNSHNMSLDQCLMVENKQQVICQQDEQSQGIMMNYAQRFIESSSKKKKEKNEGEGKGKILSKL